MSRTVDEITQDVARALRDPGLTETESAALASVIVSKRCSHQEARAALDHLRTTFGDNYVCYASLIACLSARLSKKEGPRVVVRPARPCYGRATNVIDCWFKQSKNRHLHNGVLVADVLGEDEVRQRIKSAYRHMVSNRPVANNNEPDLVESPRYHTKVQSAWVTARASARAIQ